MTIEFKPGRYYVGIWHAEFDGGNVLAAVFTDDHETWEMVLRIRHIVDDKMGPASADERRWTNATGPAREPLVTFTHGLFDKFVESMGCTIAYQPVEVDGYEWFERVNRLGLLPPFFGVTKTVMVDTPDDEIDWESGWTPTRK